MKDKTMKEWLYRADQICLAGDQDGVGHTGVVDAADHDDGQAV